MLDKKYVREKLKYLIWWKRYVSEVNTWKNKENFKNSKELVDKFKRIYYKINYLLICDIDAVHTLLFKIWKRHLRSLGLSNFVLFKNMKDELEWSSALAYVLYLYKLYELHILDWELGT